jgi:hypothetical protein
MENIRHKHIMIAVETDATRYHGEHASRPNLLSRNRAEQMLAHVSTDLAALLPDISQCTLTLAGTLLDQTQILRPGYPVYQAMQTLLQSSYQGQGFHPRLLSLGADDAGRLPLLDLEPEEGIPPGLLQLMPLLISGPAELMDGLSAASEHLFLDKGQVSPHTATAIQADFGVTVTHARFMTLTDLNAMLRLQLEHFGFLPLWELLDAALDERDEPLVVTTEQGLVFEWRDTVVSAGFETFDYWASTGAGRKSPAERLQLSRDYAGWTREYRQYLTLLQAHAVAAQQTLPGSSNAFDGSFMTEVSADTPLAGAAAVTEHSAGDLGTVAVTVVEGDRLVNYYPLTAEGLNDLHRSIREAGLANGGFSFPGGICYNARTRRLAPDD